MRICKFSYAMMLLLCVALIFSRGKNLFGNVVANLAMLNFRAALLSELNQENLSVRSGVYNLYGVLPGSDFELLTSLLRTASNLDFDEPTVRWAFARIALSLDKPVEAAALLKPIWMYARKNPLFFQDAWHAFSDGDAPDELIALYESVPEPLLFNYKTYQPMPDALQSRIANDVLAVAYLESGRLDYLEKVHSLRPDDLYVNYHLMKVAERGNDLASLAEYRNSLEHFSLEAIWPTDRRLLKYAAEVIPTLIEEAIWSREKAYTTVAFLMRVLDTDLEPVLSYLIDRYPDELEWKLYLAEFYQYSGQFQEAETIYRHLADSDVDDCRIYLRLGMLNQQQAASTLDNARFQKALAWYESYLEAHPDDLLVWKKVVEIYEVSGNREGKIDIPVRSSGEWVDYVVELGPEITVEQGLENGWTFLGYRSNEEQLVKNENVLLLLYWQSPSGAIPHNNDETWYHSRDGIWLQVIENAHSLLLNGAFNWRDAQGNPVSFPYDIYNSSAARTLTQVNTEMGGNAVVLLENTADDNRSSFASLHFPVKSDVLYLQSGWISSKEGSAFLGRRWSGYIPRGRNRYSYVVAKVQSADWRHYAGIADPIVGAEWIEVWLLNYMATGRAYFDDVFLVEIGNPGD